MPQPFAGGYVGSIEGTRSVRPEQDRGDQLKSINSATSRRPLRPRTVIRVAPVFRSAAPGRRRHTATCAARTQRAVESRIVARVGPPTEAETPWAGVKARRWKREGRTRALRVLPSLRRHDAVSRNARTVCARCGAGVLTLDAPARYHKYRRVFCAPPRRAGARREPAIAPVPASRSTFLAHRRARGAAPHGGRVGAAVG